MGKSFTCQCGKIHTVETRAYVYHDNILDELISILKKATLKNIALVSDSRTFGIIGSQAVKMLAASKLNIKNIIVPDTNDKEPVCDEDTCSWLKSQIDAADTDIIIAVGSGTINDLCKWSSFDLDLPYMVLATAASMNGYAAANVAAKIKGVKVVQRARPPIAVLSEPKIIEQAPPEMTAAGFADTIAKFQSTADWVMNNFLFDEYYCSYCAQILQGLEESYLKNPGHIKSGQSHAVKGLFEALFLTGLSMTMIGTSTPASGGEHLFSHVLDMTADIDDQGHWLHGLQVGLGTILSTVLYELILKIDTPFIKALPETIDKSFWQNERLIYSVSEQYTSKHGNIQKIADNECWGQLKAILKPLVKSPQQVKSWLKSAGAPDNFDQMGCPRERLRNAILHMHEIRNRFTIVDLAWLIGILPEHVDEIIDTWLTS